MFNILNFNGFGIGGLCEFYWNRYIKGHKFFLFLKFLDFSASNRINVKNGQFLLLNGFEKGLKIFETIQQQIVLKNRSNVLKYEFVWFYVTKMQNLKRLRKIDTCI